MEACRPGPSRAGGEAERDCTENEIAQHLLCSAGLLDCVWVVIGQVTFSYLIHTVFRSEPNPIQIVFNSFLSKFVYFYHVVGFEASLAATVENQRLPNSQLQ